MFKGTCVQPSSLCNCDAADVGQWLRDEGHLTDKSRLPVIQLNFGGNSAPGDQDDPEGRARDRSHAARCVIENFQIFFSFCFELVLSKIGK